MSAASNSALPTILENILARKREEITARSSACSLAEMKSRCHDLEAPRGFIKSIQRRVDKGQVAVIAEVKKASPSAGVIREDFRPDWIAQRYHAAGAACLSVLTDHDFFQGHEDYLQQARAACPLPVIRKDFTIDEWQVWESRWLGADAILLIMAALGDDQYYKLYSCARDAGLDVLVEVHNEEELQRALAVQPPLLGINNRDLHRFQTDLATSERLMPKIPVSSLVVGESGIHTHADIQRLRRAGIHTFLIGEAMMRADDPGQALADLLGQ